MPNYYFEQFSQLHEMSSFALNQLSSHERNIVWYIWVDIVTRPYSRSLGFDFYNWKQANKKNKIKYAKWIVIGSIEL